MSDSDGFHAPPNVQDEDVRIAVSALGHMRNSSIPSPSSSSPPSQPPPPPRSASPSSPSLVTRVSHIPLVNSVIRTYEQGKASSRVVKYGAEMMESSVRAVSRPVIDHLPVNVNQLDEFACRQLDRLDRYRRSSAASPPGEESSPDRRPKLRSKTLEDRPDDSPRIPRWIETTNAHGSPQLPQPDSRCSTPTQVDEESLFREGRKVIARSRDTNPEIHNPERQVAQRSRWQAVLLEAGGFGAALSDENMRRLKYCLHCLQYATAQIDAQILILRDFIASLQPLPPSSRGHSSPASPSSRQSVSKAHMRTLTDVRRDLVQTIRQVVDVVSKYAGGALPEPARTRVRGFILKLPQRWANKTGVTVPSSNTTDGGGSGEVTAAASGSGGVRRVNRRAQYRERGPGSDSRTSSRAPSPSSPRVSRIPYNGASSSSANGPINGTSNGEGGSASDEQAVSTGAAVVAAQRILTLATESLDMMRGVTGVMKDSLDRADAWVNRLRTVGINRNGGIEDAIPEEGDPPSPHPSSSSPHRTHKTWHHRRGSSAYSVTSAGDDDRESYYSYRSESQPGLASPTMSMVGSGSSTAYSSTYNLTAAGLTSGPPTPGGYITPGQGPHSPSVLPITPLGRLGLHDVERMDVDSE